MKPYSSFWSAAFWPVCAWVYPAVSVHCCGVKWGSRSQQKAWSCCFNWTLQTEVDSSKLYRLRCVSVSRTSLIKWRCVRRSPVRSHSLSAELSSVSTPPSLSTQEDTIKASGDNTWQAESPPSRRSLSLFSCAENCGTTATHRYVMAAGYAALLFCSRLTDGRKVSG